MSHLIIYDQIVTLRGINVKLNRDKCVQRKHNAISD